MWRRLVSRPVTPVRVNMSTWCHDNLPRACQNMSRTSHEHVTNMSHHVTDVSHCVTQCQHRLTACQLVDMLTRTRVTGGSDPTSLRRHTIMHSSSNEERSQWDPAFCPRDRAAFGARHTCSNPYVHRRLRRSAAPSKLNPFAVAVGRGRLCCSATPSLEADAALTPQISACASLRS